MKSAARGGPPPSYTSDIDGKNLEPKKMRLCSVGEKPSMSSLADRHSNGSTGWRISDEGVGPQATTPRNHIILEILEEKPMCYLNQQVTCILEKGTIVEDKEFRIIAKLYFCNDSYLLQKCYRFGYWSRVC